MTDCNFASNCWRLSCYRMPSLPARRLDPIQRNLNCVAPHPQRRWEVDASVVLILHPISSLATLNSVGFRLGFRYITRVLT